jgi:signal transduction histidine kinase
MAPRASTRTKRKVKLVDEPSAARPEGVNGKALPLPDRSEVENTFAEMAIGGLDRMSLAEVERALLGQVSGLLQPRACFLSRLVTERGVLQVSSARGRNDARIAAAQPGEGAVGRAYSDQTVVREEGLISGPLVAPGRASMGCLTLIAPRFNVTDGLMRALCAQVTVGLETARLNDDSARRTKDLQTAVAGLKTMEKAREELLANVSQDVKNPLTTIKAYLTMLGQGTLGEASEEQRRAFTSCERNADRLLGMINDLLLISRLKSGEMALSERPFGLKGVAEEVLAAFSTLATQARVNVKQLPSAEVYIRGDRERIFDAIAHLLEHAIYQSPALSTVEVKIASTGGQATLEVRDAGPGVAEAEMKQLFDSYDRTRGSGLGLPIVAKIVHLHGGRVEAHSPPSGGSIFQLSLPMFAGAVSLPVAEGPLRTGDIMLVEDDADCREVLQQVLEMEGYRVVPVATATEAKQLLPGVRPGLVLLDLRLSEEDGMSVLHFIRGDAALASTAVYIISGARDLASLSQGRGLNRIDGFFEKPLQVSKVLDTVAAVVRPAG